MAPASSADNNYAARDEQVVFVRKASSNDMRCESGTAHCNPAGRSCLEFPYDVSLKLSLEPRLGRRDRLPRRRVHDLFGRLPDRRLLQHGCSPMGNHVWRLPNSNRLVHLAPKEVGANVLLAVVM
jgi:hypothetical protein